MTTDHATPPRGGRPFNESFDARDWATAFLETMQQNPSIATDHETMTSWFANAIMRGWDDATNRATTAPPPSEPTREGVSDRDKSYAAGLEHGAELAMTQSGLLDAFKEHGVDNLDDLLESVREHAALPASRAERPATMTEADVLAALPRDKEWDRNAYESLLVNAQLAKRGRDGRMNDSEVPEFKRRMAALMMDAFALGRATPPARADREEDALADEIAAIAEDVDRYDRALGNRLLEVSRAARARQAGEGER